MKKKITMKSQWFLYTLEWKIAGNPLWIALFWKISIFTELNTFLAQYPPSWFHVSTIHVRLRTATWATKNIQQHSPPISSFFSLPASLSTISLGHPGIKAQQMIFLNFPDCDVQTCRKYQYFYGNRKIVREGEKGEKVKRIFK